MVPLHKNYDPHTLSPETESRFFFFSLTPDFFFREIWPKTFRGKLRSILLFCGTPKNYAPFCGQQNAMDHAEKKMEIA